MKKLFLLLTLFGVLAVGCTDLEEGIDTPIEQPEDGVLFNTDAKDEYIISPDGGEVEITVTTDMEYSVVVPQSFQSWIYVTQTRSELHTDKWIITFASNKVSSARNANINFVDRNGAVLQIVKFIQKSVVDVSDSNYGIDAAGAEIVIEVTANVEYDVVIPSAAQSWLRISESRSELRTNQLCFIIDKNESLSQRSANVRLVSMSGSTLQTIYFVQSGEEKVYDSDLQSHYSIDAQGCEISVTITTNMQYTVYIPKEAKWLSVADTRAEVRTDKLTFTIVANDSFDARTATVKLFDSDYNVIQIIEFVQKGQDKIFETDGVSDYDISFYGGEVSVVVTTNLEYEVVIPESAKSWISLADTRADSREDILTFILSQNISSEERSANVELVGNDGAVLQTITFSQEAIIIPEGACPFDEIWYTNGRTTEPTQLYDESVFGVNIVSNTYDAEKECWVIKFDGNVTRIGKGAFYDCKDLTSITIPYSVTSIDRGAFAYCYGLTDVTVPDYVTTIGEGAFYDCNSLANVTLGRCVTTIDEGAFYACVSLKSINFPEGLTTLGSQSFFGCSSLTSITIPGSVKSFGQEAFCACTGLTDVVIQDGVSSLGVAAFAYCSNLINCHIPDSVTVIEPYLFAYCTNLISCNIPDGVTEIGGLAFFRCNNLTNVNLPDGLTSIYQLAFCDCHSLTNITIPDSVTYIEHEAFERCSGATSLTIGDGITEIDFGTFNGCSAVTDLTIGNNVVEIEFESFVGCNSLTSITIPESVTAIGNLAFNYCSSLTSVNILSNELTLGDIVFYNCPNLTEFKGKFASDDGRCLIIDDALYAFAPGGLNEYTIPDGVRTIKYSVFSHCLDLVSITIPESVTMIETWAFSGSNKLLRVYSKSTTPPTAIYYEVEVVEAPGSGIYHKVWDAFRGALSVTHTYDEQKSRIYVPVESLEAYKSADGWSDYTKYIVGYDFDTGEVMTSDTVLCYTNGSTTEPINLSNNSFNVNVASNTYDPGKGCWVVKFDGDLYTIGDDVFRNCSSLTSVTIPDSVSAIGGSAFSGCSSLTSVTIGDSVTTIGDYAFYGCSSLTSVHITDLSAWCKIDFSYSSANPLYYAKNLYLNNELVTDLVIPNDITEIKSRAFEYCSSLTSVTIPDSVTKIGDGTFANCGSLTSVTIPDSVTTIEGSAFRGCSSLTTITIPDSVTTIGDLAFYGCSSLRSVTIPDNVTTIGGGVFEDCSSLTSVTIPDSVTTIGGSAFENCSSLTNLTIPERVTSIGGWAFSGCSSLTSVYCKATTPPAGGYEMFRFNAGNSKIYVPMQSVEAYKSAPYWSEYADSIVGYNF